RDPGVPPGALLALLAAGTLAGCGDPALVTQNPGGQATPAAKTVIWNCGMLAASRPRELTIACGDGNETLGRLRWQQWGYQNATATGIAIENACLPDCARGRWIHFPVRVIASQLILGQHFAAYGALTIDAVGKTPGGVPAHTVVALSTSGPGGAS
ncbi:MAG TPA: hypothetical protein VIX82_07310, partial [Solirubrobacteraceae bacterium]